MAAHHGSLSIPNDVARLADVRETVAVAVGASGFPATLLNRLQIAVDEAVNNIIEHGFDQAKPGTRTIAIDIAADPDRIRIEIIDGGNSFDPRTASDIDIAAHVAAGRAGGLGVFLIRKIMDVVDYHCEVGKPNRLVMIKYR